MDVKGHKVASRSAQHFYTNQTGWTRIHQNTVISLASQLFSNAGHREKPSYTPYSLRPLPASLNAFLPFPLSLIHYKAPQNQTQQYHIYLYILYTSTSFSFDADCTFPNFFNNPIFPIFLNPNTVTSNEVPIQATQNHSTALNPCKNAFISPFPSLSNFVCTAD